MASKLTSDIDANQQNRLFTVLREETHLFDGLSQPEVDQIAQLFKVIKFSKGDELTKKGDFVDYFGILLSGSAFVLMNDRNQKTMKIGDTIGQAFAADFTQNEVHACTIIASMDGLIAVIPFGELKTLMKPPNSEAYFALMQLISKLAMESFMFNLYGHEFNRAVFHHSMYKTGGAPTAKDQYGKKIKEFILKNPQIKAFFAKGSEKDYTSSIAKVMDCTEFEAGDRVT